MSWLRLARDTLRLTLGRQPIAIGSPFLIGDVVYISRAWRSVDAAASLYGKTPQQVKDFARIDKVLSLRENRTAFAYAAVRESLHGSLLQIHAFLARKGKARGAFDTTRLLDETFVGGLEAGR